MHLGEICLQSTHIYKNQTHGGKKNLPAVAHKLLILQSVTCLHMRQKKRKTKLSKCDERKKKKSRKRKWEGKKGKRWRILRNRGVQLGLRYKGSFLSSQHMVF